MKGFTELAGKQGNPAADIDIETLDLNMRLSGLQHELFEYALQAEERAMARGDTSAAMGFLETALNAREGVFDTSQGIFGFDPLQYMDPYPLEDAAAASRPDLIDQAIALEKANREADGGGNGRYDDRIASMERVRASLPHLESIREAAVREPGIRQVDLSAHCPGADNRMISRLVDQLCTAGVLVTAKIGSRVHVWPKGHPGAPTGDQLRVPANFPPHEPADEGFAYWCRDPEQAVQWAQQISALLQASIESPDWRTNPVPQPTDLPQLTAFARDTEGHLCGFSEQPDEMVVWGHIGEDAARRILGRYTKHSGVPSRRARKWQAAPVRHTHFERYRHTFVIGRPGWLLRETAAATELTVPVTVLTSPGAPVRKVLTPDRIIWLDGQHE